MESSLDLKLLGLIFLKSEPVLVLPTELNFLEVFQSRGQFSELRSQLSVLHAELLHFLLE